MKSDEFQLYFNAMLGIYRDCAVAASRGLVRNPLVIPASIAAYFIYFFCAMLLAPLGMAGGFVTSLLGIFLLSMYYRWVSETAGGQKIKAEDIVQFDRGLFSHVLNTAFIFFLIYFALSLAKFPQQAAVYVQLALVLFFNPIAEVIHQHRYEGLHALQHAAVFMRDNIVEWFLPLVVLILPLFLYVAPSYAVALFADTEPMYPAALVSQIWVMLGQYLGARLLFLAAGTLLGYWYMLFRALLFRELDSGTRRQRVYRAKQR